MHRMNCPFHLSGVCIANILLIHKEMTEDTSNETTPMDTHAEELHKAPGHGIRHYLFEFLMLFLAVFCGFLADNYRESLVNKEKERHYLQNMIVDLKADTADLNFDIYYQQLWYNHLDTALKIPPEQLKDVNKQDTFFYHFLPYYKWMQPFLQNDNTITQLRSGGFNLIKDEHVKEPRHAERELQNTPAGTSAA